MSYNKIVISSGHGKLVRGASGIIDEVDEARKVVDALANMLRQLKVDVEVFHDNESTSQDENLSRIVNFHNAHDRQLDISVHFNAYEDTPAPMGTECLYVTQEDLATEISEAIADVGLKDRGPKYRNDLYFLNNTDMPAILIETCFVDSVADCEVYHREFEAICRAIAGVLVSGASIEDKVPPLMPPMTGELRDEIIAQCEASPAFDYEWSDRGPAPAGYSNGMAVTYGNQVRKYLLGYSAQREMAKAMRTNDAEDDALTWYAATFGALHMSNATDGIDTLRHLWVLLWGLGMRESSGQYCCGRDQSASNTDGETCEAGLFQMSHNCFACSPEMDKLMLYWDQEGSYYEGGRDTFKQEVECSSEDWACYGSGEGEEYQQMAKEYPAFAAETTAIGLRHNRQHWGPINRREVEVRPEVDRLLRDIEKLFYTKPPKAADV